MIRRRKTEADRSWSLATGLMARWAPDGIRRVKKRGLVQLEWSGAKPGANQKRGIECVGQAIGWKVGKGSPGG